MLEFLLLHFMLLRLGLCFLFLTSQVMSLDAELDRQSQPSNFNWSDTPVSCLRSTQESQNQQLRSCTKVHMQGMTVGFGRAVSLTILYGYNDLFLKLEEMFNIKGELFGKVKKWEVVYTDEEEDTMMVSDDPLSSAAWSEKYIFTHEKRPKGWSRR
ncbi:auxin response factor 7-like [Zingiber officinale]|uniref:auxin response factor 7-like n=1 Tax=Zingiber officinale TaxID=94328 RepID=UPI001C4B9121|nr:auxin response factor 7-like [Zingiber officinale]